MPAHITDPCALIQEKAQRIFDEIIQITALHELNKYFSYDGKIIREVNASFASGGFCTIQFEMMRAEMLGVCRLWDHDRGESCSLPAIAYHLRNALENGCNVLSCIPASAVGRIREMSGHEWKTKVLRACAATEKIASGDVVARMFNYRDKHLAHSLRQTRREKRNELLDYPPPRYGEEGELLVSAQKLATAFYSLVVDGHVNFPAFEEHYGREARLFAESIKFLTTKEYNIK